MEVQNDADYAKLLTHIDDLKKICEKLKLDISLLEIPMQNMLRIKSTELESSSSESSSES
jgi:hypothetical protein